MKRRTYMIVMALIAACGGSSTDDPGRGNLGNVAAAMGQGSGATDGSGGSSAIIGNALTGGMSTATGGAGTTPFDDSCTNAMIEPMISRSPGNVLVIYDRSLSMDSDFAGGQTRFQATDAALRAGLQPFVCPPTAVDGDSCIETLTVGAILFPSDVPPLLLPDCSQLVDPIDDSSSQIYWQPVSSFLTAWDAYWNNPATNQLLLGTPIEDAFKQGAAAISTSNLPGTFVVLFLTDGESTCLAFDAAFPAVDAPQQAQMWAAAGIKTYVVSVAPPMGTFNDTVAQAGGTSPALNPTDTTQLTDAIQSIVADSVVVADCKTTLTGQQVTDIKGACERGTVTVGTSPVACDPVNGFQIVSATEMELFGTACDVLKTGLVLKAGFPCDVLLH